MGLGEGAPDSAGGTSLEPLVSGGVSAGILGVGVATGGTGMGAVWGTAGSDVVNGGIGIGLVFGASGTGVAFCKGVSSGVRSEGTGLGEHPGTNAARISAMTLFMRLLEI